MYSNVLKQFLFTLAANLRTCAQCGKACAGATSAAAAVTAQVAVAASAAGTAAAFGRCVFTAGTTCFLGRPGVRWLSQQLWPPLAGKRSAVICALLWGSRNLWSIARAVIRTKVEAYGEISCTSVS